MDRSRAGNDSQTPTPFLIHAVRSSCKIAATSLNSQAESEDIFTSLAMSSSQPSWVHYFCAL